MELPMVRFVPITSCSKQSALVQIGASHHSFSTLPFRFVAQRSSRSTLVVPKGLLVKSAREMPSCAHLRLLSQGRCPHQQELNTRARGSLWGELCHPMGTCSASDPHHHSRCLQTWLSEQKAQTPALQGGCATSLTLP